MIHRIIESRIKTSNKSILLLGSRQVGKSTLCHSLKPDLIVNLSDQEEFASHIKDPGLIRRITSPDSVNLIVIDEIQRIPELLNTIQYIIDSDKRKKFVLIGSSARKLKRGGANLLPGRVVLCNMPPLIYWEVQDDFKLERALTVGTLPGIYLENDAYDVLDSYANLYLREEIQTEALVKNLGDYSRFLDLAAIKSGEQFNYAKIASDGEIKKDTARRYFSILEDTLLIHRLESFTDIQSPRRAQQRDLFLFFDMGVRNAILKITKNTFTSDVLGGLFEQWFRLQCLYYNEVFQKNWKLSYFRTDQGDEVDLIIETQSEIYAIEIKYSKLLKPSMCKGLYFFNKVTKKPVHSYIVYTGEHKQQFETGMLGVNYKYFLEQVLPQIH